MGEVSEDLAMTVEQCMIWLTDNTVTWRVSVDPHVSMYKSMEDYLGDTKPSSAFLPELEGAKHLYEIQAYPNTPVGFQILWSASLVEGLRQMVNDISEIHLELKEMTKAEITPGTHTFDEDPEFGTGQCIHCGELKGSPEHPITENLYDEENTNG